VIYGIANVAEHGWQDTWTVVPATLGILTLVAFVAWETRARNPLLPLAILRDRVRGGAFLSLSVVYGPGTALVLLMLVFLQGPLHEGALSAGLHFAPIPLSALLGALASMRLMRTVSPVLLIAGGSVMAAAGMLAATRVGTDARFLQDMAPAFALFGFGSAVLYVTANALALRGVRDDDTALASAVINAMQQVGAALGVAILSSVAARAAEQHLRDHGVNSAAQAVVHGNNRAFALGALLILVAGLFAATLVRRTFAGISQRIRDR
jgi:hypothetical protein